MIADDHSYIKARMEQIKADRLHPSEVDQDAIDQYLGGEAKEPEPQYLTMDWSIYAPVNINAGN